MHLKTQIFLQTIEKLLDTFCPVTAISKRKQNLKLKPWITFALTTSMKIRDNIYKTFFKAKEPNLKKQLYEKYKLYRNQIVTLTRVCKENYYQSFLENTKTNSKKIWSSIRSIMKNTKANNKYSLLINKALTTNEKDIANHFNTFFTSIAQKLVKKIPPTPNNFKSSLKNQNERSFFIGPVDIQETENIISSLQENKASGPNSLPIKMLKTF